MWVHCAVNGKKSGLSSKRVSVAVDTHPAEMNSGSTVTGEESPLQWRTHRSRGYV